MKRFLSGLLTAFLVTVASNAHSAVLLEFDFSGATNTASSNTQNSTFSAIGIATSSMTRGTGISNNNAANSFRGTGFSNDGIAVTNTDYFQFAVNSSGLSLFSIESLAGNFNGTSTFSANPGVTMQWAYSLDGTNFSLAATDFVRVGSGAFTYTFTGTDATALTDISSATFRLFASGQTTTGGWGLQSAATPGTVGLTVNGTVTAVPEPSSLAILSLCGVGGAIYRRRRAGAQSPSVDEAAASMA